VWRNVASFVGVGRKSPFPAHPFTERNNGPVKVGHNAEESNMTRKSFGQEYGEELVRKAVIWGPPIVGGIVLGPVGIVAGAVAAAAAIAGSGSSGGDSAGGASQSNETGSR
jgi:hypothetical protein